MKEKYLLIDAEYRELIGAVELSEQQVDAMRWLMEKGTFEDGFVFIKVDKPLEFKEI